MSTIQTLYDNLLLNNIIYIHSNGEAIVFHLRENMLWGTRTEIEKLYADKNPGTLEKRLKKLGKLRASYSLEEILKFGQDLKNQEYLRFSNWIKDRSVLLGILEETEQDIPIGV